MITLDNSNSIAIGGIRCWDMGTEERFEGALSKATRKLVCAWNQRGQLINQLSPGVTTVAGVQLYSSIPYPDFPWLYPQEFKTKGEGVLSVGPAGLVQYEYCIVTAEYEGFKGGDPLGYVELEYGASVITLPKSGPCLRSKEAIGSPAEQKFVPFQDTPPMPVSVTTVVRGRSNVSGLPLPTIRSIAENPINDAEFLGFPAGTVIFDGGRARRSTFSNQGTGVQIGAGGTLSGIWDVEYRFICRPKIPWDHVPFRDGENFILAQVEFTNGNPYIGRSNLNQLF